MPNILVVLNGENGKLQKASLVAITAALELKTAWSAADIVAVCFGLGSSSIAEDAARYGLSKILYSAAPEFNAYLAPAYAEGVKEVAVGHGCSTVVFPGTSLGKDLAPRVAALLDAGQASDIVAVNSDGSLKRPMYAGNVIADVELTTANKVITVRSTAFLSATDGATKAPTEEFKPKLPQLPYTELLSFEVSKSERPQLGDADTVVSGGRAMQSAENFEKFIFPLADAFGAAVGASRAAVDSGYAPNDWQVGQTGKIVAPNLYVAVGISGAIQHLAGMKDSKVIVAINKDAEAPIFEVASFGLVADLFQAVPELTEAVLQAKRK